MKSQRMFDQKEYIYTPVQFDVFFISEYNFITHGKILIFFLIQQ